MAIYSITNGKLLFVQEIDFRLGKDIQKVVERNISQLFGWDMIRSEFILNNFRIDTLAFDVNLRSFVTIPSPITQHSVERRSGEFFLGSPPGERSAPLYARPAVLAAVLLFRARRWRHDSAL